MVGYLADDIRGARGKITIVVFVIYILSGLLIMLLMNWAFGKLFLKVSKHLDQDLWNDTGYGLIFLFGMPIILVIAF